MPVPDTPRQYSPPSREEKFVANLDAAIKFHRENKNDPHGIANAVLLSLVETRNAFAQANGMPVLKK